MCLTSGRSPLFCPRATAKHLEDVANDANALIARNTINQGDFFVRKDDGPEPWCGGVIFVEKRIPPARPQLVPLGLQPFEFLGIGTFLGPLLGGLKAGLIGFEMKILIAEMSFIRPNHRREKIHKFGHMHLDDFIERADRFRNELIILQPLQHALPAQ
jgi:hypothetical protein